MVECGFQGPENQHTLTTCIHGILRDGSKGRIGDIGCTLGIFSFGKTIEVMFGWIVRRLYICGADSLVMQCGMVLCKVIGAVAAAFPQYN
jgi:hypothetical protein